MFLINNYMAFITINHYKVLMYKNSTISAFIVLSFALFFTFANLNLALGQNAFHQEQQEAIQHLPKIKLVLP